MYELAIRQFAVIVIIRKVIMINRIALAALIGTFAIIGPASAQTQPFGQSMTNQDTRKDYRSDRSLRKVSKGIEREIRALEHDQHDYAGHRVAALNDLKQAREEIQAALAADAKH